jgi:hypothetical protein
METGRVCGGAADCPEPVTRATCNSAWRSAGDWGMVAMNSNDLEPPGARGPVARVVAGKLTEQRLRTRQSNGTIGHRPVFLC